MWNALNGVGWIFTKGAAASSGDMPSTRTRYAPKTREISRAEKERGVAERL